MNWRKYNDKVLFPIEREERDELLKVIRNPSAQHTYRGVTVLNVSNETFTANEIESISVLLDMEEDDS